jgi:hypothetical protein
MNEELERILSEALDLLEQGVGVEAIVARYPAHAAELRPFLLTATQLARLATQPSLTAEQRSKRAFLAAAAAPRDRRAPVGGRLARLFAPVMAVVLLFLLGGTALVGASASATPGSALYETKRLVESLRLGLATDPERAAVLRERFRQERLAEIEQLLADGRAADVTFIGTLAAIDGPRWTVDGLPVDVTEAVVNGTPRVGALVEITGRVVEGAVRAARVVVLSGELPEATPTPPPTPPAEETDDAGAAEIVTVTPTPTATVTPPPAATSTAPATATATPPAAPSATPGEGSGNDNDDDDSNDNDDNSNDNDAPPPPPSATPDDNSNDNDDDNSNDNDDDNSNDDDDNEAPTPPPAPTPDDDNSNDNDDDNDDDNANDNDDGNDNGNDNDDDDDNSGGDDGDD